MMLRNDSKPLEVSDPGCLVTLLPPSKSLHPLHQDFSCLELQEVGRPWRAPSWLLGMLTVYMRKEGLAGQNGTGILILPGEEQSGEGVTNKTNGHGPRARRASKERALGGEWAKPS